MTKNFWIGAVIAIVVAAGAYMLLSRPTPASGEVIKIGVAAGQTGIASEWGEGEGRLIEMLADDVNKAGGIAGQPLQLFIEDTRSDDRGTVDAITKLISIDHVQVILGPTWGDSFQGGNPVAEQSKVVLLSPSNALETLQHAENFPHIFSTWWPQVPEIDAGQNYLSQHDLKKIVVINDKDAFTYTMGELFVTNLKLHTDLTLAGHIIIPIDTKDYRTILTQVKALNPDVIWVCLQDDSQDGPFMKQARELNIDATIFSVASAQNTQLVTNFAQYAEGLLYTYPSVAQDDLYKKVAAEYKERYGVEPSFPSFSHAYNAFVALVDALNTGARTGDEIMQALHTVAPRGLGIAQVIFDEHNQVKNARFEIHQIKNGKFVTVQ